MHRKDFTRAQRVGDQIQRELAGIIAREVDDPRVGDVTLSGVDVSKDLGHAKVLVTVPVDADAEGCVGALNRAARFIRHRLAGRIRMRHMPSIRFEYDPTLDQANRLDALIESVAPGPEEPVDESQS